MEDYKQPKWKIEYLNKQLKEIDNIGQVSDGYHTFDELYDHRIILYLSLLSYMNDDYRGTYHDDGRYDHSSQSYKVWYSDTHFDGSKWDGWLIVGCVNNETQEQISYHINSSYEYLLKARGFDKFDKGVEWDGHTSEDVMDRLTKWLITDKGRK